MSESIIQTKGLTKFFNCKLAVDDLDLCVSRGSVLGFLGPNGAGKTTTIRMLMGHLHATEGSVTIFGRNPWHLTPTERAKVAYVSENMNLPGWMTPKDACALNAGLYPDWDKTRADELVNRFGLRDAGAYAALSKGQKRALLLVLALSVRADLLVLDEPASGLDVAARRVFLDALLECSLERQTTVFFSSHLLTDIERVVDHVVMLKHGRMALAGELDALKDRARLLHVPQTVTKEMLREHFDVAGYHVLRDGAEALVMDFSDEKFVALCEQYSQMASADVRAMNLEDLFVEVVREDSACCEPTKGAA